MNILITGGSGFLGKNLFYLLKKKFGPDKNIISLSSKDGDLRKWETTLNLFDYHKPKKVIHCAGKVGGLGGNMNYKGEYFYDNIMMNTNVIEAARLVKVEKLVCFLSTCVFPDDVDFPLTEEKVHLGEPHFSNYPYAYAKRMLEVQCKAYRENYGSDFQCVIPTNIYGPHDNYHLEDAHVIPALIHKCYLAKQNDAPFIMRGTGKPLRQFIYSEDLAKLIMWTLESNKEPTIILSVSEKDEVSIEYVTRLIAREFDYEHRLEFDTNFSDGQYKKTAPGFFSSS